MLCIVLCLVTQSCLTLCDHIDCSPPGSLVHGDSQGKNTGVGCHARLQGIFPTQGLNPRLPHCRQILYHLSHQGSPKILEWVAYPFSGDLSDPGIEPGSPALQVDSLSAELPGKIQGAQNPLEFWPPGGAHHWGLEKSFPWTCLFPFCLLFGLCWLVLCSVSHLQRRSFLI